MWSKISCQDSLGRYHINGLSIFCRPSSPMWKVPVAKHRNLVRTPNHADPTAWRRTCLPDCTVRCPFESKQTMPLVRGVKGGNHQELPVRNLRITFEEAIGEHVSHVHSARSAPFQPLTASSKALAALKHQVFAFRAVAPALVARNKVVSGL